VVIESYRPGYLAEFGVGYDDLVAENSSLIMTSITPFGQTGPYSQYKGEEVVNYAMGLIMSISGIQGEEPLKHGGFQAQYEGGSTERLLPPWPCSCKAIPARAST